MAAITIGIPFLNPGFRINYAIKSVFAQSFQDWELLLVDDGSNDGSTAVAASLDDPRVRLICDGVNRGLPTRLNQIAEMSRARVLVRMDADDLMHPERVSKLMKLIESNERPDVVWSASVSLDTELRAIGRSQSRADHVSEYEVFRTGGILHPTIAASRDWFLQNPYKADYVRAEDRELFVRTFRSTKYAYIDEPLYYYFHIGNVRPSAYALSYRTERRVLREYGNGRIGRYSTLKLLLRSYLKSVLLYATSKLGVHNAVFRHQPTPLSECEREAFQGALARIKSQSLPTKQ